MSGETKAPELSSSSSSASSSEGGSGDDVSSVMRQVNEVDPNFPSSSVIEYRIPVPVSLEEYSRGFIYTISKRCALESKGVGDDAITVVLNEAFTDPVRYSSILATATFLPHFTHIFVGILRCFLFFFFGFLR